jgi:hypothetical protein
MREYSKLMSVYRVVSCFQCLKKILDRILGIKYIYIKILMVVENEEILKLS